MKLSEAIRLGSMLKPQGRGHLLFEDKTCALGAACEADGVPKSTDRIRQQAQMMAKAIEPEEP